MELSDLREFTKDIRLEWRQENPIKYKAVFQSADITVSDLLSRISPYVNVTDIRIEETSTEEIVEKIYQKGISNV